MSGDVGLSAFAMSVVFGLCVPGVSQGKIEQTLPTNLLLPLTNEEKKRYADAIKGDDYAYHVQSDEGFILVTTKDGSCRVITAEGSSQAAALEFRQRLEAGGGKIDKLRPDQDGYAQIDGMIPLTAGDAVVLDFTAPTIGDKGFFASAFGVHKNQ